jgi:erythromycin esterase
MKYSKNILAQSLAILLTAGCSASQKQPAEESQAPITDTGSSSEAISDISYEDLTPYVSDIDHMDIPPRKIIAFGEATHGNKDFTQLKMQIFKQLVSQQNIRAFAIEGDFGGCQKVNSYIQNGVGTAEEAAGEIGFAIYKTQEMADLLEWMKGFNESQPLENQIRFYGFDMQRYDNNKEELFTLLDKTVPQLSLKYQNALEDFTDDTMYDLKKATVEQLLDKLNTLNAELEDQKDLIISSSSPKEYDLIRQYIKSIEANTQLRIASSYGTVRDGFMAEYVSWILDFEEKYYGSKQIFITGHNGHIGKTTATFGTKKVMGEILADQYGEEYYAIGSEFYKSNFLAPDTMTGKRTEFEILNKGDERLALLLHQAEIKMLFLDMKAASANPTLYEYLTAKQPISSVGEGFSKASALMEKAYTQKLSPLLTYDGIVFVDSAEPSAMIQQ